MAVSGDIGYTFGGFSDELDYNGAITVVGASRLTLVGELAGRRLNSVGRLTETVAPHPRLIGVETVRLTSVEEATNRLIAVGGFKWNLAAAWLVDANVSRPLTTAGLTAGWIPTVSVEYSFGR